jgi:hypothetical protein
LYSLLGGGKGKAKEGGNEVKVAWLKSLGWGSDACVEFQGFAGGLSVLATDLLAVTQLFIQCHLHSSR